MYSKRAAASERIGSQYDDIMMLMSIHWYPFIASFDLHSFLDCAYKQININNLKRIGVKKTPCIF
jgi:hypothetical protein